MIRSREIDNHTIYIVDNLFRQDLLQLIYNEMSGLAFACSEYSNESTKHIKYFNHNFEIDQFRKHPLFRFLYGPVAKVVEDLYPDGQFNLERVHCNNQRYGEVQTRHTDVDDGMTALFFANPEWPANWEGEILFYDKTGEPFHAVIPKPGRVLLFPGNLVHRGGVPSRYCFESRLTVAFKYQPTVSG